MKPKCTMAVILTVALTLTAASAAAKTVKRVLLLPFAAYSESGQEALKERIASSLASQLGRSDRLAVIAPGVAPAVSEGSVAAEEALRLGTDTKAQYVILGSATQLGSTVSVDVTIISVDRQPVTQKIYASGTAGDGIEQLVARLARNISELILPEEKIAAVIIKGTQRIEEPNIRSALASTPGKMVSKEDIAADVKAIYKLGFFSDVTASTEEDSRGTIITFAVQEMPTITEILFEGNKNLDAKELKKVLTLQNRDIININLVRTNIESIKTLYEKEGYRNAQVSYKIDEGPNNSAVLRFTILESGKLYIKTISFEGNTAFTDEELKAMMETSEWTIFHLFTDSGVFKEETLQQDLQKITAFYHNNGYIDGKIGEPEVVSDAKWIYVSIPVTEGKQYRIGVVQIVGDTIDVPREELYKGLRITKKDYFNRQAIITDLDYLQEKCNDEGYAYAKATPEVNEIRHEQLVNVTYRIDKGEIIYINRITISGNTKTRDKVLRRMIPIVEGNITNRSKMKTSYMRLSQLRYFEEINFQSEQGPEKNLMDINIQVKEKATGMFSVGAGYSAIDHLIVMAQITQQNLFGRGQTLSLNASVGSSTQRYELSFVEPWLFDMPLWSKTDIWNNLKEYDSYDLDTKGIETILGYPLFEYVKGYVGYRYTVDNVNNIAETASKYIMDQEGQTISSGVTFSLVRDTTNDWMFPSEGSKNSMTVEHTGTIFQGDTSYTKYSANSSWFFPLPLGNIFAIRGRAGYIHGNEGKEVPVYERFYLGGINSLRGLRSVGPVDESGDVIGGKTMLLFNAELIVPLLKDAGMKGVVFYDTGNAWESGYHVD
ncbi:MAG: outer membrane protein assembly factor BamA, partial [Deltaproteobacteria bacterium]|nr:outer membrane protein assembly factor BamA [Deltaproteobacteria bacterium]